VNGKITEFRRKGASGAIQSDQGGRFHFDVAAVLAYDVAGLSAGQVVSFEPDGASPPKAINVSVLPPASIHYSDDRYQ
jgi:cold shock CspA family protein